ncbi:16S rRNA (guanine(527)-N(7))-methyltransferase GidB [Orientia chuto str. Dubai]|uniref:Ribosomal RNA small subunit methyltransferase G n=1 Tax=Orientia chuto str. Dubai TaxID=1359168 RepID=A0A0F3MN05_9RICK|nr:16S rRNA (guanine(527)-N(7))-methyltransferase RsmG [Candidatus Orientia mediorientalis]KJV57105.1 16S rRNA (guanine(527)-N(7))-methyltransferase GidB [Orientia chuto str. Dubai]
MFQSMHNLLNVNYNVSRETFDKFQKYYSLLSKWNSKINLVSATTLQNFWQRHILDSIQLLNYIHNKDIILVDLGSGAGFPGVVLSIAGIKKVVLIESDSRKAAFLLQAAQLSEQKIEIINDKIQNLKIKCDIVTVRALANIDTILSYTKKFIIKEKYLILKGKSPQNEITQSLLHNEFNYKLYQSCTKHNSYILEIKMR